MSTFTAVEAEREYYQPRSFRKEKEQQVLYLSMVAFFNGETKIVVHKEARLKSSSEEELWLTKDETAQYHDSLAAVDRIKLQKAEQVWATRVPKTDVGGDTLVAKVNCLVGERLFVWLTALFVCRCELHVLSQLPVIAHYYHMSCFKKSLC